MAIVAQLFSGHPYRIAAAAALVLVGAAAAWYLGSPLFITTTTEEAAPAARVIAKGQLGFIDSLHSGTGEVQLLAEGGRRIVRFEGVRIQNGPDLHVYLSKDAGGRYAEGSVLYLGPLKATSGSFNYDVPAGTDVSAFKSVVVWCRAFAVLFTWADLG